jgi:hypothetical protein
MKTASHRATETPGEEGKGIGRKVEKRIVSLFPLLIVFILSVSPCLCGYLSP